MKQYLITEEQLEYIINNHVLKELEDSSNLVENLNENVELLKENRAILKIRDLARGLASQFGDDAEFYYDVFLEELNSIYRQHGDKGVIKMFRDSSGGIELVPMDYGRYTVK